MCTCAMVRRRPVQFSSDEGRQQRESDTDPPCIHDLPRDFYAENIYAIGPLLDKAQRDNAGRIVCNRSRNTATDANIARCRADMHRMLEELWKRMPASFDKVMAETARADG